MANRNPILIGQAQEIDLVQPQVRRMLEAEGIYIGTDSDAPEFEVPMVVMQGKVYCMNIDRELDPERFKDSLQLVGPFRAAGVAREETTSCAGCGHATRPDLLTGTTCACATAERATVPAVTNEQVAALVRSYKVASVTALADMAGMDGKPSADQLDASIEAGVRAVALSAAALITPPKGCDPKDDRILWGVVANAGRLATVRKMRWAHVSDATGLGSQSSIALCQRFGFDPDQQCGEFSEAPPEDDGASPTDSISALIEAHAAMLDRNPYSYFELAYTRQTEWMAWLCSKPAQDDPARKVLANGQGSTPHEACSRALATLADAGSDAHG